MEYSYEGGGGTFCFPVAILKRVVLTSVLYASAILGPDISLKSSGTSERH